MQEREKKRYTWREKRTALVRQLAPHKATLVALGLAEILMAAGHGVIPYITGKFLDALIAPSTVTAPLAGPIPLWAVFIGLWGVVQLAVNTIDTVNDRRKRHFSTSLEAGIQARAFAHLLTLPVAYHKQHRAGEVMDTVSRAGWMLASLTGTVLSVGPQFLTLMIGIGIAFAIKPSLAAVLLAGVVLYLLMLIRTLPSTTARQEEGYRVWRSVYGDAADAYANVYTVKQASAEHYERERILKGFMGRALPAWYKMERLWSAMGAWQRIVVTATQGAIFLFSVYLIGQGELTIGELIAFNAYAGMIIGPFVSIGYQWQTVQNALTTLASVDEIFATEPEEYEPAGAAPLADVHGNVTFRDVQFAYEAGKEGVLRGVTFDAKAGEVVALVGTTGAGKTTTAELISGYYFPDEGEVLIDGHDIRQVNLRELRSRMAIVPQEVVLFNASIADNIRYGRPEATDAEVEEAAKRAHANSFIERFPSAYQQEVGERGVKLSVGQKQRIAIARAMLRDPRILILDEPTSALDAQTEAYITESLDELMRGRTTFVIAHRLSTVRKADQILVLADGTIVEHGRHEELLAIPDGTYRRLYELHIGLHE